MRVAIVGGGISGLSAALRLIRHGCEVTVYEREAIGGLAGTQDIGGIPIEKFYHHLFRSDTDYQALVKELGLQDRILWFKDSIGIYCQGRVHPFTSPRDLLLFRPLALLQRVLFGMHALHFKRRRDYEGLDEVSVEEWYRRRGNWAGYETIWKPLLKSKFADYHPQVPAAFIWGRIRPRAGSPQAGGSLGYMKGGFAVTHEAIRERLVHAGGRLLEHSPVQGLGRDADGLFVLREGLREEFDAILSTLPIPVFARLVSGAPVDYLDRLRAIRYMGVCCLLLELDRPLSSTYWINVADPEITFGGVIEHTNLVPAEWYGGKRLVYLFNYVPEGHPYLSLNAEEYYSLHLPSLKRVFPNFSEAHVLSKRVAKTAHATPVYTVGFGKRMLEIQTPVPGVYLATTAQIYPLDRNMSHCVQLSMKAADVIAGCELPQFVGGVEVSSLT